MNQWNVKRESTTGLCGAGLFDSLLSSISERLGGNLFAPPEEIVPFLEEKEPSTEEEGRRLRKVYDEWIDRVLGILKNEPTAENLRKFVDSLPEPFRGNLKKALLRMSNKRNDTEKEVSKPCQ